MIVTRVIDIPPNSYDFEQELLLNGVVCAIRLYFNERANAWFMDASCPTGVMANGTKVVINQSLLGQHQYKDLSPSGVIFAYDTTNGDKDPGREDLGTRVKLLYVTRVEDDNTV